MSIGQSKIIQTAESNLSTVSNHVFVQKQQNANQYILCYLEYLGPQHVLKG